MFLRVDQPINTSNASLRVVCFVQKPENHLQWTQCVVQTTGNNIISLNLETSLSGFSKGPLERGWERCGSHQKPEPPLLRSQNDAFEVMMPGCNLDSNPFRRVGINRGFCQNPGCLVEAFRELCYFRCIKSKYQVSLW